MAKRKRLSAFGAPETALDAGDEMPVLETKSFPTYPMGGETSGRGAQPAQLGAELPD